MNKMLHILVPTLLILAYEGDDKEKKTFTQEELNTILADERRKSDEKNKTIMAEFNTLKSKSTMTAEEIQAMNQRLEEANNKYTTETEQLKESYKKLDTTYKTETAALKQEVETHKSKFIKSTIQRAITDAASAEKAYSAKQIIPIIEGNSRLVDVLDEAGKPTGDYSVMVKIPSTDTTGKAVTLDLPVDKAVKRLKETDEFANLFRGEGTGGTGQNNRGGSGKGGVDLVELARTDPAAYRDARAKGAEVKTA